MGGNLNTHPYCCPLTHNANRPSSFWCPPTLTSDKTSYCSHPPLKVSPHPKCKATLFLLMSTHPHCSSPTLNAFHPPFSIQTFDNFFELPTHVLLLLPTLPVRDRKRRWESLQDSKRRNQPAKLVKSYWTTNIVLSKSNVPKTYTTLQM